MINDWMDSFNVTKCPVIYTQNLGSLCLKFVKINNLTSYIDPWFAQYIPSDYPVIFIIEFQVLFDFVSIVDISRQYFDWVLSWISDSGHSLASTEPQLTQGRWTQLGDSRLNFSQDPRTWLRLVSAVFTPKTSHLVPTLMYRKWINQAAF